MTSRRRNLSTRSTRSMLLSRRSRRRSGRRGSCSQTMSRSSRSRSSGPCPRRRSSLRSSPVSPRRVLLSTSRRTRRVRCRQHSHHSPARCPHWQLSPLQRAPRRSAKLRSASRRSQWTANSARATPWPAKSRRHPWAWLHPPRATSPPLATTAPWMWLACSASASATRTRRRRRNSQTRAVHSRWARPISQAPQTPSSATTPPSHRRAAPTRQASRPKARPVNREAWPTDSSRGRALSARLARTSRGRRTSSRLQEVGTEVGLPVVQTRSEDASYRRALVLWILRRAWGALLHKTSCNQIRLKVEVAPQEPPLVARVEARLHQCSNSRRIACQTRLAIISGPCLSQRTSTTKRK